MLLDMMRLAKLAAYVLVGSSIFTSLGVWMIVFGLCRGKSR